MKNVFIILYILTNIAVLTDFPPLKIAGILSVICYLPSLSLYALFGKDRLKLEDLILAFPGSIGISAFFTLVLLYVGVDVKFMVYIMSGLIGVIFLLALIRHKKVPSLTVRISPAEGRFMIIALFATFILSIPVISERIAISHHGFHHFSIVSSIFNGFFPPENPGLGGSAIGYHWGYHVLVAAISYPANINPLRIFSVFNILSLFFIFCVMYRAAKTFKISEGYCYLVPLTLIGLMRSDAVIFYAYNLIEGGFPPVKDTASPPLNLLTSWVSGVSYLDTRLFFMNKFYNANNMPVGLCLIFTFFLVLLLPLEEKAKTLQRNIYMVFTALILVALAVTYAFFLIIPLLFIPVWAVVLFLTHTGNYREKSSEVMKVLVPCVAAALIAAPYLFVISSGGSVVTEGKSASEYRFIYLNVQTVRNLVVFLLPSPFIAAGLWCAFRSFAFSRRFLFLLSGSVIFLLLSVFLRLNWSNSAKFSFILSFFFAFFFVFALMRFVSLFPGRHLKNAVTCCAVLFLFASPVLTEAAYICSPWFDDNTYAFDGRRIVFAENRERNEAYTWIRENTRADALLLLNYYATSYAPGGITIAQTFSYRPVALTERSLFVIKDVYAYLLPEYEKRVSIRTRLFEDPEDPQVRQYLTELDRPVYLLVEGGYDDPLMKGVVFNPVPEDADRRFLPVFENGRQSVYKIEYN